MSICGYCAYHAAGTADSYAVLSDESVPPDAPALRFVFPPKSFKCFKRAAAHAEPTNRRPHAHRPSKYPADGAVTHQMGAAMSFTLTHYIALGPSEITVRFAIFCQGLQRRSKSACLSWYTNVNDKDKGN